MADELLTLLAGVSVAALVAGDAVRTVFHLDVFASAEGLLALFAAKPVAHDVRAEPGGERGGGGRRARAGGGGQEQTQVTAVDRERMSPSGCLSGGGAGSEPSKHPPAASLPAPQQWLSFLSA